MLMMDQLPSSHLTPELSPLGVYDPYGSSSAGYQADPTAEVSNLVEMPTTKRGESSKSAKKPAKNGVSAATKRRQAKRKQNSKTLTLLEMARNQPPLRNSVPDGPKNRKIIRWNSILDRELLMALVHQGNYRGFKIDWDEISLIMGRDITQGSIEQHLARMRVKHARNGYPVPPPLSRVGGLLQLYSMKPEIKSMKPGVKPKPLLKDYNVGTGIPDFLYALGKGKNGGYIAHDNDNDSIINLSSEEESAPVQNRPRRLSKKTKDSGDEDVIRAKDISDLDTESSDEEEATTDASDKEKRIGAGLPCLNMGGDKCSSDKSTNSNDAAQYGIPTAKGEELVGRLSGSHNERGSAGSSDLRVLNSPFVPKDDSHGHQTDAMKEMAGPTGYNSQYASAGQHQSAYASEFSHANPINSMATNPYAQQQVGGYTGNNMAMPQGYNVLQMGNMTGFPSGDGGFQPIGLPGAEEYWTGDNLPPIHLNDGGLLPFNFDNVGNIPQGFVRGELDYSLYDNSGNFHPLANNGNGGMPTSVHNTTQNNVNVAGQRSAGGFSGRTYGASTIMRLSSILNAPQGDVNFREQGATGGVTGSIYDAPTTMHNAPTAGYDVEIAGQGATGGVNGGIYGAPTIVPNVPTTGYLPEVHALAVNQVHTDNAGRACPNPNLAIVKTPTMPPPVEHPGASWNISPGTTSSFSGTAVPSNDGTIDPRLLQRDVPEEPETFETFDDFNLSACLGESDELI